MLCHYQDALACVSTAVLTRSQYMQGISSTDVRSEVRNCAVRTLFAVVVSQGNRMSSELWDECLWEILFPLLQSVHHTSVTSSREEVSGCTLLHAGVLQCHHSTRDDTEHLVSPFLLDITCVMS